VFETGKQVADVYRKMCEDQGADLKYTLQGIPDTSIGYDPDVFARFFWECIRLPFLITADSLNSPQDPLGSSCRSCIGNKRFY
jgi:hypothetical protein